MLQCKYVHENFKGEFEQTAELCPGSVKHILANMMDHGHVGLVHLPVVDACIALLLVSPDEAPYSEECCLCAHCVSQMLVKPFIIS